MSLAKKALTPLMIGFLLISFAVAVGVVIMNLGAAEIEEAAQCAIDVGFQLAQISGQDDVCYNAAQKDFVFTLENGVNINVEGVIVNIIGTKKAETFDLTDAKMIKAGTYLGHVPYDRALSGEIRQVKVSPKVVLYDAEQICTEQALVIESVGDC